MDALTDMLDGIDTRGHHNDDLTTQDKSGWAKVAFGDVVRKVSDRVDPASSGLERYVAGEHMVTDELKITNWGLIGEDY